MKKYKLGYYIGWPQCGDAQWYIVIIEAADEKEARRKGDRLAWEATCELDQPGYFKTDFLFESIEEI